jgi:hypothetical protein
VELGEAWLCGVSKRVVWLYDLLPVSRHELHVYKGMMETAKKTKVCARNACGRLISCCPVSFTYILLPPRHNCTRQARITVFSRPTILYRQMWTCLANGETAPRSQMRQLNLGYEVRLCNLLGCRMHVCYTWRIVQIHALCAKPLMAMVYDMT